MYMIMCVCIYTYIIYVYVCVFTWKPSLLHLGKSFIQFKSVILSSSWIGLKNVSKLHFFSLYRSHPMPFIVLPILVLMAEPSYCKKKHNVWELIQQITWSSKVRVLAEENSISVLWYDVRFTHLPYVYICTCSVYGMCSLQTAMSQLWTLLSQLRPLRLSWGECGVGSEVFCEPQINVLRFLSPQCGTSWCI